MSHVIQAEPNVALAGVYQAAGLAEYAEALAPRILDLAFELDWTGRTLLDLGSATGDLGAWFTQRDFRVTGIDNSAAMIKVAETRSLRNGADATYAVADLRDYRPPLGFELVTCIGGTLNYMKTTRDLEAAFQTAAACTLPKKYFCFDIFTIRGLAAMHGPHVVADNESAFVLRQGDFNYETLLLTNRYTILEPSSTTWQRAQESHVLRGFPVQSIVKAAQANGFRIVRTLTPDFRPVESMQEPHQLLWLAQREEYNAKRNPLDALATGNLQELNREFAHHK